MPRINVERQKVLLPKRMAYAIKALKARGIEATKVNDAKLEFEYNGAVVSFWPYSGWHSGKSIKEGRGIENLLKQLDKRQ